MPVEATLTQSDDCSPARMANSPTNDNGPIWTKLFWVLIAAHFVVWTAFPILTQPNVPLDPVEIVYWGHEWEWGYYKHPPLPSWLAEGSHILAGPWGVYLLSQGSIVIAFWGVWRLAREMVGGRSALFAVLLLECCPFYNLWTPEFNHGVCMCASWGLAIYGFYLAVERGRLRDWVATGIALGLGLLTKYNTATLIAPMLCYLVFQRDARRHWRTAGPYLTMVIGLGLFAPHLGWAYRHGSTTVTYILERTKSDPHWLSRIIDPFEFLAGQVGVLLPLAIGLLPLVLLPLSQRDLNEQEHRQRQFLLAMFLGPVGCYLLVSVIMHRSLTAAYGTQLWLLAGLVPLFCFRLAGQSRRWGWTASWCLGVMLSLALGAGLCNVYTPYLGRHPSRIHCPGAALALAVEQRWNERYAMRLPIAAGEWWLAGNVNYYGASRASVYCGGPHAFSIDLIPAYSDWTSDGDLNRRGGVILWDAGDKGDDFPVDLRSRFPVREAIETISLPYQTGAQVAPLRVGMAFIPPGQPDRLAGRK